MSERSDGDERSARRLAVQLRVSLVLPAQDGPVVLGGTTIDIGLGGCRVALSRPVRDDHDGGVLVLRVDEEDVAMLVAPVCLDGGPLRELSLRFVAPTEPDSRWSDCIDALVADDT